MSRVVIFYRYIRHRDRWFNGDRHVRNAVRRVIRGPEPIGGIDLVYLNLCAGLKKLGIDYVANPPWSEIRQNDLVGVIGRGRESLEGYRSENQILAGVAVTQHPDEWPTLFDDYPIARYVVHSKWVSDMFSEKYGNRIVEWAVGIDTDRWRPSPKDKKTIDILIYDKVRWDYERVHTAMVDPILDAIRHRGLKTATIRYGKYKPNELATALARSKSILFLCEHETQGLAYQQAMSAGLPVLAWDPGQWLDPWRYRYSSMNVAIPATSVPFFDWRCGETFRSFGEFERTLDLFLSRISEGFYHPRKYVEEHLTLEHCARNYVDILKKYTK